MKALPAVFIIVVASLALAGNNTSQSNSPPVPDGKTPGRFQLVEATVDFDLVKPEKAHRYLFRIDTATGQVWRYYRSSIEVNIPGHPELKTTEVDAWIQTMESLDESMKSVRSFSEEMKATPQK